MKRPTPPCYGCTKHAAGCHGKCEEYKAFRAALDEWNRAEAESKAADWRVREQEIARSRRLRKIRDYIKGKGKGGKQG